jgi:hypothetical protein
VPEVCLEAAHYGDETIAKLTIKQRDRRLAKFYKMECGGTSPAQP